MNAALSAVGTRFVHDQWASSCMKRVRTGPSAATSIMKNVGARITQERAELSIEIMGMAGLGWEGEGFSEDELTQTRTWLWGKAVSIYGGSSEIQNNGIAKRRLGRLDHQ